MRISDSILKLLQLKWSDGNSKLSKDNIISFNLPAYETSQGVRVCHGASAACSTFCYARQGFFTLPVVQKAYHHNHKLAYDTPLLFAEMLKHDLALLPHTNIRMHSSGDFFNMRYFQTWVETARLYDGTHGAPLKTFYCYSKVAHMLIRRMADFLPRNFLNIQSYGGKFDNHIDWRLPVARVFKDADAMHAANDESFLNGDREQWVDGSKSDMVALSGNLRIGLIYHGVSKAKKAYVESV